MVGLGEVLWDVLPSGRALGGAPTNFAYMTSVLGDQGVVASRVGNDVFGREAEKAMQRHGLTTSYIQHDDRHETGSAAVSIDPAGLPAFTIQESVAWDFLQWTPAWEGLAERADVVCFGSLAQRSPASAATIDRFLGHTREDALRIFDVNLRQAFYSREVFQSSFCHANIVKLTDQELLRVSSLLRLERGDEEMLARRLLHECDLRLVCVTRGERGSLLISEDETVIHEGLSVKVVDTVGAGDAFTACLAHHFVRARPLREISESANRFASWVATQVGATPRIDGSQLQEILAGK
jgi:fructokinase